MKQNQGTRTKSLLVTIGMVVGTFSFFLFPLSLINCTKTPTNSDNTNQLTVNSAITQNTTWTSGTDYIIEGTVTVEQGVSLNITCNVDILFKVDYEGNKGKLWINGSMLPVIIKGELKHA